MTAQRDQAHFKLAAVLAVLFAATWFLGRVEPSGIGRSAQNDSRPLPWRTSLPLSVPTVPAPPREFTASEASFSPGQTVAEATPARVHEPPIPAKSLVPIPCDALKALPPLSSSLPARPSPNASPIESATDLVPVAPPSETRQATFVSDAEAEDDGPTTCPVGAVCPLKSRDGFAGSRPVLETELTAVTPVESAIASIEAGPIRRHRVVEGDTLENIAIEHFHDSTMAKRIFEANRDRLTQPDLLPLGIYLRIPAR